MSRGCGQGAFRSGHGQELVATYETNGERIIFNVPLIPGETTIVSWKKLINEANLATGHNPSDLVQIPVEDPSSSSIKKSVGEAGYRHLNNVGGVVCDDKENIGLGNFPDDEYDIDDMNEDDMVDNSKLKHEGFFVHYRKLEHTESIESMVHHGRKRRHCEILSNAKPEADSMPNNDPSSPHGMEGSLTTMVEVAIKELENTVAEFRSSTSETKDLDHPSQASKKTLPPEIQQKLAKVVELTEDIDGKVPKDVIDRLMGIVGHLIQVRTLKRNLKAMADMKSLAKSTKEKQVLNIKKEVSDMMTLRFHKNRTREPGPEEWEESRHKRKLGKPLEDKIFDLYELYLEGQEDTGPSLIRVYNELASLWPAGFMNFDRIRRAIDRAKRRR